MRKLNISLSMVRCLRSAVKTDKEDVQEIIHAPEDTLEAAPVEVERPKQPEPVDDPEDDLLDEMKD